jgi:SAM-dependent methyltransferase
VPFVEIDGVRCYAPERAGDYADYPVEGFDVTARLEADSFWCRSRNRILRGIVERFTDRSRKLSVLEVGCGIGGVVAELRQLPHLEITASEIYLHGLHYARQRFPDVQFVQLDATAMPFRAEFDVVGAFDVLEHIEADQRAISGIHQALRPGGLFVLTVPQYQWMWSRLDEGRPSQAAVWPRRSAHEATEQSFRGALLLVICHCLVPCDDAVANARPQAATAGRSGGRIHVDGESAAAREPRVRFGDAP